MFDPVAFGERIEAERNRMGLTFEKLVREVSSRTDGAKGASYGTVYSYAKGQAPDEPREKVVRALAGLFEVREEWLLHGSGPRTAALEAFQREAESRLKDPREERALDALLAVDYGVRAFLDASAPFSSQHQLVELVITLLLSDGTKLEDLADAEIARAVETVVRFWSLPERVYGGRRRSREWYGGYYGALAAIMTLVLDGGRGDPPALVLQRMEAAADSAVGRSVAAPTYSRRSGGVMWAPLCPACMDPVYMERKGPRSPLTCPKCGATEDSVNPPTPGND